MLRNNDFVPYPLSQKSVEFVAYVTDEENYEPYTSLITDGEAKAQKEKSEKKKKYDFEITDFMSGVCAVSKQLGENRKKVIVRLGNDTAVRM